MKTKPEWRNATAQKLVRYEALFNLIDDIQMIEDIGQISQKVTKQWKYFANVAQWRLTVAKDKGFLIIDGFQGDSEIQEVEKLPDWDEYHLKMHHPRLIKLSDPWQGPAAPGHLTGKNIIEIEVQQFRRMEQHIAILSVAARHEPFSELDNRFIRIFGSHLADRFNGMLLREAALETLVVKATKDGLTGLLNRATVFEQFTSRHELAMRTGEPLSVILADIDFFKVINDSHGHLCGDQVLKEVSRRLQLQTRAGDQLGRYGGEEFLTILYPCDVEQVKTAAERFRRSIAETAFTIKEKSEKQIKVTISIGTASTLGQGKIRMEELLKQADDALYKSKATGRDRVTIGKGISPPDTAPGKEA